MVRFVRDALNHTSDSGGTLPRVMFRPIHRLRALLHPVPVIVLLIMLLSAALRIYRLDAQSFWYDEGNSARIAERPLALIIAGAAGDIHPPLYYTLLHYWRALFGETEFALRMLSVVCGLGLVLFTYLLARRLWSERVGLVAAALLALSPFAIYYSQEARMYALMALEAVVSTWALTSLFDWRFSISDSIAHGPTSPSSGTRWLGAALPAYILSSAAGLYTQYAYPFVMLAQGLGVLAWLADGHTRQPGYARWRKVALYAGASALAIVLFAPWLPIAIRQITTWPVTPVRYELGQAVLDSYRWLVVGRTLPLVQAALPLSVISLLVLIGAMFGLRLSERMSTLLMLLLVVVPFVLLFVFHLYREAYLKILLVCAPPLLILAARGIDGAAAVTARFLTRGRAGTASQRVTVLGIVVLGIAATGPVFPSLYNLYANPAYARDDYRGIAKMIEANARPGDAVLLDAPNQWEVFTYYHRKGAPAIPLAYRPPNASAVDRQMRPIATTYQRLFVLYYGESESDPTGEFEQWLAQHAFKADEQWVGNIRLAVYATRAPEQTLPLTATFGNILTLQRVAVDLGQHQDGEVIPLELTWQARAKLEPRYKIFVHIGLAESPPVAQNDSEPAAGTRPTNGWQPDVPVVDQRGVWLKPGTVPGHYGMYLGVYDRTTGKRLSVQAPTGRAVGDQLWLGDVTILPAP